MTKTIRFSLAVLALAVLGFLYGCSDEANSPASCAVTIGNGGQDNDRKVRDVYFPGDTFKSGSNVDVKYFPCNPRNYIINPAGQTNANGNEVGDRHTPVKAFTKSGTEVGIWLRADWTPNQNKNVLKRSFSPVCLKFDCWSSKNEAGSANYADPGWNGMLGETFSDGIDATGLVVTSDYDDDIWRKHDTKQWQDLAKAFSEKFNENVRPTTGYADDLFCGSGDVSGWKNPDKPGEGEFTCGNVRFTIKGIFPLDDSLSKQTQQVTGKDAKKQANSDQLEIAKEKYGNQAQYWLGLQDTLGKCPKGSTCPIYTDAPRGGQ